MTHWIEYIIYLANTLVVTGLIFYALYKLFRLQKIVRFFGFLLAIIGILYLVYTQEIIFTVLWNILVLFQLILALYIGGYTLIAFLNKNKFHVVTLPNQLTENLPLVTVVIAVHNEEEVIDLTIKKLLKLRYAANKLEIIIVDDCSSDSTPNILQKYANKIRIVSRSSSALRGKPAALNELIPTLNSELIAVFDADSMPEEDFLLKAVKHFKGDEISLLQTRNRQYNENNTLITKLVSLDIDSLHLSAYSPQSHLGFTLFEGRGGVFRRDAFVQLNGFDTELPTEDWDFAFRLQFAGHQLAYDHSIYNYEQATETFNEFVKQRKRWLGSTAMTFFKNMSGLIDSKVINRVGKTSAFVAFFMNIWSVFFNVIGLLGLIGIIQGYTFNGPLFLLSFSLIVPFYNITPIIFERKWHYLFYLPLMYLFYWSYTIIVPQLFIDKYILKEKTKFKKAEHGFISLEKSLYYNE